MYYSCFVCYFQLEHGDSIAANGFSIVRNEPDTLFISRDTGLPLSANETIDTTVEDNDHSIATPFIIAIWILWASIAKIGKWLNK